MGSKRNRKHLGVAKKRRKQLLQARIKKVYNHEDSVVGPIPVDGGSSGTLDTLNAVGSVHSSPGCLQDVAGGSLGNLHQNCIPDSPDSNDSPDSAPGPDDIVATDDPHMDSSVSCSFGNHERILSDCPGDIQDVMASCSSVDPHMGNAPGTERNCEDDISSTSHDGCAPSDPLDTEVIFGELVDAAHQVGYPLDGISNIVSSHSIQLQCPPEMRIHNSSCSWQQYYPVLSFLMTGNLHADYERIGGLLGFPACSSTQWNRIVKRLEEFVSDLAEWSCSQVRKEIMERRDDKNWMASFDGFYLTRGHYSNNSSATLHDYSTGKIAWYTHRTKRGPNHNWCGTSAGAETDMLDELLGRAKEAGFSVKELICDKDSSTNATFCRHYPEGMITYCSNHSAKNMHKALEKIKKFKCECKADRFRCKRMTDATMNACKTALGNLIASDKIQQAENPLEDFSDGIRNFVSHYCHDVHTSPWCHHPKVNPDGSPYRSDHYFTCKSQVAGFSSLLDEMAMYPQDYVSDHGRLTTNTVEGFHGLALVYRDKRTDLSHTHYVCKTNMAVCHKNLGPIWKALCFFSMGVDMPLNACTSILKEQREWVKQCRRRSKQEHIHKRNLQKKAKKKRYEEEKAYMERLRGAGCSVGEYVGDGQGESATVGASPGVDHFEEEEDDNDDVNNDGSGNCHPLLIFYDCEATGLSIYEDHITDIGAKVVACPIPLQQPSFSSLVKTSKNIPAPVTKVTGISQSMLRNENYLSDVLPQFLQWVTTVTAEVSDATSTTHFPVLVAHNGFKYDFSILFAEVERRKLSLAAFDDLNISFSDPLPLLRVMKKEGQECLKGTSLSVGKLHEKIVGMDFDGAHRALPDVLALEAILTHPSLVSCLTRLEIRSFNTQLHKWVVQKRAHHRKKALMLGLGNCITAAQASRMDTLGIGLEDLIVLRNSTEKEGFLAALKERGLRSKVLREKLQQAVLRLP